MSDWDILTKAAQEPEKYFAYTGELMLLKKREGESWQVSFALPMDTKHHPFNKYKGKANGRAGTRFMAILVEIDDDEQPVDQGKKHEGPAIIPMGKSLVRESGILRNDLDFTRYLWWKYNHLSESERKQVYATIPMGLAARLESSGGKDLADEKLAKRFNDHMVHALCGVLSCREFAYNKKAADAFGQLTASFHRFMQRRQERHGQG